MRALPVIVTAVLVAQPPTDADCLLDDNVECPEFDPVEEPEPEPEVDPMDCWAAGLCDEDEEDRSSGDAADSPPPPPQVVREDSSLPPPASRPDPAAELRRYRAKVGALIGVGTAVTIGGIALMAAGAGVAPTTGSGPMCTTGKRCGDTCIALDKTCHVGSGGSVDSPGIPPKPEFLIPGGVMTAAGVALIGAGIVIWLRQPPRLTVAPTSVTLTF